MTDVTRINHAALFISALFGLGEADDPDVLKRNLKIADLTHENHHHDLTKEHRRELCDSGHLTYQQLQDLMKRVSR